MNLGGRPAFRLRKRYCVAAAAICAAVLVSQPSHAQKRSGGMVPNKPALGLAGERLNANTIAIISGNLNATYVTIAYDLSAVLDDGDEFRVLPVIGKGGGQNIKDVRFLKGVDLGITQSNLLGYYKRNNEIGPIDDKIVYIAKLFNEEMHLVVRADSGITSIEQLAGRKVNFSDVGSGTQLSTRDVFERLGIKAEELNMGQNDALEKLKSGEIAATILIAGKPAGSMAKLKAQDGFRILPGVRQAAADRLPAGDAERRGLSGPDRAGAEGRNGCGRRGADRVQLAEGHRPLPADPEVRRRVLSAPDRIPETAASSQMARSQSGSRAAGLEAVRGCGRMAALACDRLGCRSRAVRQLSCGAPASSTSTTGPTSFALDRRARSTVPGVHEMVEGARAPLNDGAARGNSPDR